MMGAGWARAVSPARPSRGAATRTSTTSATAQHLSTDAGRLAHNCAFVQDNTIGTLDLGASGAHHMTILEEFPLPGRMGALERSAPCHPGVARVRNIGALALAPRRGTSISAWRRSAAQKRHAVEARSGRSRSRAATSCDQNVERLGGAHHHNKFNLSMRQHAYQQLCSIRRCFATDL
jgi:hypothetical protein